VPFDLWLWPYIILAVAAVSVALITFYAMRRFSATPYDVFTRLK